MQAVWRQCQHPSVSRRSTPDCIATQALSRTWPSGRNTHARTHALWDANALPAGSRVAFDPASYIGNVCIHTTLPLSPHTTLQTLGLRRSRRDSNQRDGCFGCDRAAVEFERYPCRAEKPRGALKATQMGFKFNCAVVKRQNLYMTYLFRAFEVVSKDDGYIRLCRGSVPL